jgi:hypothetical protein
VLAEVEEVEELEEEVDESGYDEHNGILITSGGAIIGGNTTLYTCCKGAVV